MGNLFPVFLGNYFPVQTGYTNASFLIYTTPFKYSYEIIKEGFVNRPVSNWDTITTLIHGITLERVQ